MIQTGNRAPSWMRTATCRCSVTQAQVTCQMIYQTAPGHGTYDNTWIDVGHSYDGDNNPYGVWVESAGYYPWWAEYGYDNFNRLNEIISPATADFPLGTIKKTDHFLDGSLKQATNARGQAVTCDYEACTGRLSDKTWVNSSPAKTVQYKYYPGGALHYVWDWTYDSTPPNAAARILTITIQWVA